MLTARAIGLKLQVLTSIVVNPQTNKYDQRTQQSVAHLYIYRQWKSPPAETNDVWNARYEPRSLGLILFL